MIVNLSESKVFENLKNPDMMVTNNLGYFSELLTKRIVDFLDGIKAKDLWSRGERWYYRMDNTFKGEYDYKDESNICNIDQLIFYNWILFNQIRSSFLKDNKITLKDYRSTMTLKILRELEVRIFTSPANIIYNELLTLLRINKIKQIKINQWNKLVPELVKRYCYGQIIFSTHDLDAIEGIFKKTFLKEYSSQIKLLDKFFKKKVLVCFYSLSNNPYTYGYFKDKIIFSKSFDSEELIQLINRFL
ncbi:hypothetical protein [Mycoplasmopsis sturni]|uniref:hypothetical protein n=1 Tax=Mycoplasmopsis sturni TaxID=39047 RepID=UPI00055CBB5E|nr:hypothetical protein [Mycoplasmopsis sturni]